MVDRQEVCSRVDSSSCTHCLYTRVLPLPASSIDTHVLYCSTRSSRWDLFAAVAVHAQSRASSGTTTEQVLQRASKTPKRPFKSVQHVGIVCCSSLLLTLTPHIIQQQYEQRERRATANLDSQGPAKILQSVQTSTVRAAVWSNRYTSHSEQSSTMNCCPPMLPGSLTRTFNNKIQIYKHITHKHTHTHTAQKTRNGGGEGVCAAAAAMLLLIILQIIAKRREVVDSARFSRPRVGCTFLAVSFVGLVADNLHAWFL